MCQTPCSVLRFDVFCCRCVRLPPTHATAETIENEEEAKRFLEKALQNEEEVRMNEYSVYTHEGGFLVSWQWAARESTLAELNRMLWLY